MSSLLESTKNTRALLPDSLKFIRSDVPDKITAQETQWLIDNGITTVIDLREESEYTARRCSLEGDAAFDYRHMPVTGGNAVPTSVEGVPQSYIKMADEYMESIIETIMNAPANVIYFCSAGKDRTGVVSAIILHRLGYSRRFIIDDYMQSGKNLMDMIEVYAARFPQACKAAMIPQERFMEAFLDHYCAR